MTNSKKSTKKHLQRAALIGGSASLLMALFTPSVIAAEVNSALTGAQEQEELEVIEITGVRSSLENALNVKREATSIVDAISATDIDSLPALNLGEALQALPGIQLNTDDGQRNAEINLRGLKGGFVKVTAEGQGFATPSRSAGMVGGANPFGSFEGGVFDGVTVVKSPTADMQEGGIAGIVDKKLQRALGKPDGRYSLNFGSRYEELADTWNSTLAFSGSKHLIKDRLAIAWKVAGSEQNFRRDTANFRAYNALNTIENNTSQATNFISPEALQAYKDLHGITEPLAIIKVIGSAAQVTENSRGNRISATGNIEYKVTDSLKIGANLLYTKRDLGESTMEDFNVGMLSNDRNGSFYDQRVTLSDDINDRPIKLSDNQNFSYNPDIHNPDLATVPVYAATVASISNVNYTPATRLMSYTEEAKGIFLYANYSVDDWVIDGTVSKSSSVNEFQQSALDIRHQSKTWASFKDPATGSSLKYAPTGITAYFDTGKGDLEKAQVSIEGWDSYVYSALDSNGDPLTDANGQPLLNPLEPEDAWQRSANGWSSVPLTSNSSKLDPKLNPYNLDDFPDGALPEDPEKRQEKIDGLGGKSVEFFSHGRVQRPEREYESGELNFKRFVDIGGDAFRLLSVKFGGRHERQLLETYDVAVGAGGINVAALNKDTIFSQDLDSADQAEYFNGDYPNYITNENGWQRLNSENLAGLLQEGGLKPYDEDGNLVEDFAIADPTGFAVKLDHREDEPTYGLNDKYRLNFNADQVINAVYLMGEFEGEVASLPYTGNLGVRYVETTNDIFGQGFDEEGKAIAVLTENDYSHTLPVLNLAFELADDVMLRTAYSKGLVRPNLLAQSPSPQFQTSGNRVRLENSKAEVLPYTSQNFDLSLEWYNREGSAIAIGMFKKEIEGKIETSTICPIGNEDEWGVGPLQELDVGKAIPECREIGDFEDENGDVFTDRLVTIKSTYNSDIPITVNGYELSVQQKLDFLPYPWNGFGGVFNFTKIDLDEGEGQPMTRIAPYSYNLITYYENKGFNIRLAYNWQDEKLLSAGGNKSFLGSDARTQTAGGRLDLSTSYRLTKQLKLSLRAYNLTNTQQFEYIGGNEDAISRIRYSGRIYSVGLNYSF
ncbi:rhodanese-like protein [Catenovulum agarivorans DS-2]|uniref:Rhodanese-like protein n=1 Tax=Catenovulum agarivorans DS-2 TaxID=1328313 RepID=W7QNK3_9ALTE|nr:TonB-dependent receptor [Catenovulum agarivorans]EWH10532.1 rhodanese-like protein [Catenovulum agarivorans DS-2]